MSNSTPFTPMMRDGVTASTVFLDQNEYHSTTFAFLCQKFPHISAAEWQQRFDDGLVMQQDGSPLNIHSPYLAHTHIYYYRHLCAETVVPFSHDILFENEEFIVVDKPHFLTVSPTGQYVQQTLLTRLKKQFNNPYLTPIHRIDRETAGLILISKNIHTRGIYQQLFANKQVQKTYHAIAKCSDTHHFPLLFEACMQKGNPFYTMQITQGKNNSQSKISCLEKNHVWAKYQLEPITGKQHQLRVHMNAIGLPLLNDSLYPKVTHAKDGDFSAPLQLLAKKIEFLDPVTAIFYSFESKMNLLLPEQ